MADYDYSDKVALVTGAGSGIGEARALTFARSGAKVIVADYDKEGGNRVTEAIKAEGREAIFVEVDVSKPEHVVAFLGSSATSSCTGGYYLVDGAYTAQCPRKLGSDRFSSWAPRVTEQIVAWASGGPGDTCP